MRIARPAFVLLLLSTFLVAGDARAASGPGAQGRGHQLSGQQEPPLPPSAKSKHPKLATIIAQLVEASESLPRALPTAREYVAAVEPAVSAATRAGLLQIDGGGRVQVYIRVTGDPVLEDLRRLGVGFETTTAGLVQARVAVTDLLAVSALDGVIAVTPPKYGRVAIGDHRTEGDAILNLDDLRAAMGVDGTGVTVGVISDGIGGLSSAIASDDLPPTTFQPRRIRRADIDVRRGGLEIVPLRRRPGGWAAGNQRTLIRGRGHGDTGDRPRHRPGRSAHVCQLQHGPAVQRSRELFGGPTPTSSSTTSVSSACRTTRRASCRRTRPTR